jgi:uncharacterized protein
MKFWKRMIAGFVLLLAGAYVVIAVFMYVGQSYLVYYPSSKMLGDPGKIGHKFEDVSFMAADGVSLHGWFVPANGQNRPVLLWCHGNGGNISGRLEMLRIFTSLELNVFTFDYRGYGLSEGEPQEQGTYRDVEAAWEYLTKTRRIEPTRIVVLGRSLGGPIAAHLAARQNPAGLILVSTFTALADVGQEVYPYLPVRLLSRIHYPTRDKLIQTTAPVMILHSQTDELIDFHHGRELFEAANEPKRFVEIGGGHNEVLTHSPRAFSDAIRDFIGQYVVVGH